MNYFKLIGISSFLILGLIFLPAGKTRAQNAQAGKIWYASGKIYVNSVENGVLIINNKNPSSPKKEGFIRVAGNVDLAVRGDILYVNNNDDLLAVNISKPKKPKVTARIEGVFPHRAGSRPDGNVSWEKTQTGTVTKGGLSVRSSWHPKFGEISDKDNPTMNVSPNISGGSQGGSMSCFTITGDKLYTITDTDLQVFDISTPSKPKKTGSKIRVGNNIETLFSNNGNLFVGAQDGMYIYDLSRPDNPKQLSKYTHVRGCDPVVTEGDFAYVTVRSGSICGNDRKVNVLDVVDIREPKNPKKVRSYNMNRPAGLGVDNGMLFVCDGHAGLKVIDAKRPNNLQKKAQFPIRGSYDLIPVSEEKLLIVIGEGKLYQYDYSQESVLKQLSVTELFPSVR